MQVFPASNQPWQTAGSGDVRTLMGDQHLKMLQAGAMTAAAQGRPVEPHAAADWCHALDLPPEWLPASPCSDQFAPLSTIWPTMQLAFGEYFGCTRGSGTIANSVYAHRQM